MSTVQGAVRQSDWISAGGGGGTGRWGLRDWLSGGSVANYSREVGEGEEKKKKSSGHILVKFGHSHMCLNKGGL